MKFNIVEVFCQLPREEGKVKSKWFIFSQFTLDLINYRPQTKFAKVMFLHVCVCPQRGSASVHDGILPLARQTPHPPSKADPPGKADHHLGKTDPTLARQTPTLARQTPQWQDRPPWQDRPLLCSACWEIRSTSGRYASYWNAILFNLSDG